MKRIFVIAAMVLGILVFGIEFKLGFSYESFTLSSTPNLGLSFYGPEIDVFTSSGKDVSMGLGLGLKFTSSSTDTEISPYTLEIFSSSVYKGRLTRSMRIEVHSKGGASIPNMKFENTGFFAEVSILFYLNFYGWDFGFGGGIKSYSFESYSATYIPLKMFVGKVF